VPGANLPRSTAGESGRHPLPEVLLSPRGRSRPSIQWEGSVRPYRKEEGSMASAR